MADAKTNLAEMKNADLGGIGSENRVGLDAIYDIPVEITVVLGRNQINVNDLLHLESGSVLELNRRIGEPVDVFINERLVARGEIVIVDENIGITLSEIIKTES